MIYQILVLGTAAPQGSKRHVGRGIMVESCKRTKPFRDSVAWAVREQYKAEAMTGAVRLDVLFVLPRPKSLPKKIVHHIKKPDRDKLLRAVCDGLKTGGLYLDDSQVVEGETIKVYVGTPMDERGIPYVMIEAQEVE